MADKTPALDLVLSPDRPIVRVDKKSYELRTINELTLVQFKRLETIGPQLGALLQSDALTKDQGEDLSRLLAEVCQLALLAPPTLHAKLGDLNRILIVDCFMTLLPPTLVQRMRATPMRQDATRPPAPPTGTPSSVASNGSTAGIRSGGRARSHSGS